MIHVHVEVVGSIKSVAYTEMISLKDGSRVRHTPTGFTEKEQFKIRKIKSIDISAGGFDPRGFEE